MAQGGVLKPIRHRTDGYVPRDWSVPEGSECTYTGCRRGPSDCAGTLLSTASKSAASRLAPPINTSPTIASSSSSLRSATERMMRMFCVWTGRPYPRSSREFAAWTLSAGTLSAATRASMAAGRARGPTPPGSSPLLDGRWNCRSDPSGTFHTLGHRHLLESAQHTTTNVRGCNGPFLERRGARRSGRRQERAGPY